MAVDYQQYSSLLKDIFDTPVLVALLKEKKFAIELYQALTNVVWNKIIPEEEKSFLILAGRELPSWGGSMRHVSSSIAEIRSIHYNAAEDYMDFYCCAQSATVTTQIIDELFKLGWYPEQPYDNIK